MTGSVDKLIEEFEQKALLYGSPEWWNARALLELARQLERIEAIVRAVAVEALGKR